MLAVTSKDGTKIAYQKQGSGPALVLVDGALCWTEIGPTPMVMPALAEHFTVYAYDRRGRGKSSNTEPYTIDREIEDLATIMQVAGQDAYMCGFSSGAALAMYAVAAGLKPKGLVMYEAPFFVIDDTDKKAPTDAVATLDKMVANNQRKAAVNYFFKDLIGIPGLVVLMMNLFMGKNMKRIQSVAHTLPYDVRIMDQTKCGPPHDAAQKVKVPTLVIYGEKTSKKLIKASQTLAQILPHAQLVVAPKASHVVKAESLVPALIKFSQGE